MARRLNIPAFSVLVIATTAVTLFAGDIPPRKKVLITYFEPQEGEEKNASETVAQRIAADSDFGVDIELCRLPVVYDQSGAAARKCFEKSIPKPAYVISLGEAACTLEFETAAQNRDSSTFPDNAGNLRTRRPIDPSGPASAPMTFPIDELLCGSQLSEAERALVNLSASPGGYVCNNTAYSLARYFTAESPNTRFGFVHVPNHHCKNSKAIPMSSEILKKYIKQAVANDADKSKTKQQVSSCVGLEAFPQTLKDFKEKLHSLKDIGTRACRAAYLYEGLSNQINFESQEKFQTKSF